MEVLLNKEIGIIGMGFVGSSVAYGFRDYNVKIYDIDQSKSKNTLDEVCQCDIIFLCLPTPMDHDGSADMSHILAICNKISDLNKTSSLYCGKSYVLKSTVPVGTTKMLSAQFKLNIVHNPEFLTANNAKYDFTHPDRIIIGGNNQIINDLFSHRFPGVPIINMTSNESEAVKYIANCFFALKVSYFNEVYFGIAKNNNLDWQKVLYGVLSDKRIGDSHTDVPGPDGKYGYGGACFTKDTCSMIKQLENNNFDPLILKACHEQNNRIRNR